MTAGANDRSSVAAHMIELGAPVIADALLRLEVGRPGIQPSGAAVEP
jgi:hypothetical protein